MSSPSQDEAIFLDLQQRRLSGFQSCYAEPNLPKGTDDLILAARPGGKFPLLLAGVECSSGVHLLGTDDDQLSDLKTHLEKLGYQGRTKSGKKEFRVMIFAVEAKANDGTSPAEPLWSEPSGPLKSLCWDHGGGCFAAASECGKGCQIDVWSVHDGTAHSVGRLAALHQPWPLDAMCFSGFRLAAAARGSCCTFISLIDVDTCHEMCRLVLPKDISPRCINHFLLPLEGASKECLVLAADHRVFLWNLDSGASDERTFVDVAYSDGDHGTDVILAQDQNSPLAVTFVKQGGPAHNAGVEASGGWLLSGWRPLHPSDGNYCLNVPWEADSWANIKKMKKVLLRFQSPKLDIATLEMDDAVNCAVPSEDGTLLAVGCKKLGGGQNRKSATGQRKSQLLEYTHSTLSVWSLETGEFWRTKDVHLSASIPALCWLNRYELVVVMRDIYAVGVVNIESGALVRRWSFGTWSPKVIATTNCCPWIAVGTTTGRGLQCRVTIFSAKGGGCILPAALSSKTLVATGHAKALPAVAFNDSGQFLAVESEDGNDRFESTFGGSTRTPRTTRTTTSMDSTGRRSRRMEPRLVVWQIGDTNMQKVTPPNCHIGSLVSVALSGALLAACFHIHDSGMDFLKVFRLPSDKWPQPRELFCGSLEQIDRHQTVAVKSSSDGEFGIAAVAGNQSGQFVGLACWTGEFTAKEKLRCAKHHIEVVDLAFLPGQDFLAGLVNLKDHKEPSATDNAGSICCIWNLCTPGVAQICHEVRLHGMPRGLSLMAVGQDFQRRHREEGRNSPVKGRLSISHAGLVARDSHPPAQVATSGESSHIVVHEVRTGFRTFLDISKDAEGAKRVSAVPRVLRFASSGRLLAVGDNCGQVHLFQLGHSTSESAHGRAIPAHRVLCLSGEVVDIALHDEQLAKVACWHATQSHDPDEKSAEPESVNEENKVLVYDLLNPCLEFLLPDLKMKAEDSSSAFCAQLDLMPSLLHQKLPVLGWTLLHCCACRGQAQHARLLVRLSASPFQRDASGRNVLDVALQHNEFGVVEDLMTVLMGEHKSAVDYGHAWDQLGENGEVLGRALLASSLPAEHLALTRTVVRLLRFRTATLPDFLDTVCWGTPRHFEVTKSGETLESLPSRGQLQENKMRIRSYRAAVHRSKAPEFEGLVPHFEDSNLPERPIEIRVWYLRGALDDDIGMIRALKDAEQEEIMRTKFVQVLLEEQWNKLGHKQFRRELCVYLLYLISWGVWCMTGRSSCPPPPTLGEDLRSPAGFTFQLLCVVLIICQIFFLYQELTQFFFELQRQRAETQTRWARLRAIWSYSTTWNNLDMARIALVTTAVVRSYVDRAGLFVENGDNLLEGRNLLAITTVFVCSRLVSFLRAWSSTGPLVRTLIIIFWDMSSFFWVMFVMVLTFVFAFLLLFDQPFSIDGLGSTLWYVYMHGIFGDADDAPEGADSASLTARLLLVICVIVMLVVMMNFLIAIMSDSYDKVQENAEVATNVMRLELVYEAEVTKKTGAKRRKAYVFTCQGVRYAGGGHQATQQENSRWEGRVRQVEKAVRRESRQTCMALAEQAGQLSAIEDRIHSLECHVNQSHGRLQETMERLIDQLKQVESQDRNAGSAQTTPRQKHGAIATLPRNVQGQKQEEGIRTGGVS